MTEAPCQSLHLLFVLEHFAPMKGGVETLFSNLCEKLVEKGHRVTVITTLPTAEVKKVEQRGGLTIRRYPFGNRYLFTLLALLPVLRYGREADLIHTTSYNAGFPAFLGGWLLGKKVFITFHEVWGKLWFQLPYLSWPARLSHYLFEKMLTRLPFHRFVAVSRYTEQSLRNAGVREHRIRRVYNGIDHREIRRILQMPAALPEKECWTYTFFGRLGVSKGLDLLLPAARSFADRHPDARLRLIIPRHPKPFLRRLLRQIRELGLQDHVQVFHQLPFPSLIHHLAQSDAVVIPSYSEGFCFAAAETMAVGTPIISSGRAALREVIGGKYVEMKDQSPEALTFALEEAYAGRWREAPLQRFTLAETVAAYLVCYEESI